MSIKLPHGMVKPYKAVGFEKIFEKLCSILLSLFNINGSSWLGVRFAKAFDAKIKIQFGKTQLKLNSFHPRLLWRYSTAFNDDEPLALDWLASLKCDDVLYDIGANVGIFSLVAAKISKCRVYAFEPDPLNYAVLVSNIVANDLEEYISPLPFPITDCLGMFRVTYRTLSPGDALQGLNGLSRFSHPDVPPSHELIQLGIDMQTMHAIKGIELPTAIKLDTDGGEYSILTQMIQLQNKVENIYLEDNKDEDATLCHELLTKNSFKLINEYDKDPKCTRPFSGSRHRIYSLLNSE